MAPDIWSNVTSEGIIEYAVAAFDAIDPWFYPLVMLGFIGYIYGCMHSAIAAVIAIIITIGLFAAGTNIFIQTSELTILLYLITVIGIAFFITTLMLRRRNV